MFCESLETGAASGARWHFGEIRHDVERQSDLLSTIARMRARHHPLPYADVDEVSPSTLIASMVSGDAILLAADSLSREEDGTISIVSKLHRHPDLPTAWGFSGESLIGGPFSAWMQSENWLTPALTWETFTRRVCEEVNRRNRDRRNSAIEAGAAAELRADDLLTVLVAGLIADEVDVWEFNHTGRCSSVRSQLLYAIGTGSRHARNAYFLAKRLLPESEVLTAQTFNEIAYAAVYFDSDGCREPIHLWRIGTDGIEDLSR